MKIQTFSILAGTATCNAKCPYCISKMTGTKRIGFKEPEVNWRNFNKGCRLAQVNNVSTVLITGKGEPTLYPKQITRFLVNMKKFDFPLIELQTNALLLGKRYFESYLKRWHDLGLNTIAVSIVHYKKRKNREIFTPDGRYPDLENLIKKLHRLGFSVRLTCVLIKGFIDSAGEMQKLADFAKDNHAEQLTVRKLGIVKCAEDKKTREWCIKYLVSDARLNEIKNFLDRNAQTLMTLPHGAIIYEMNGQNICLTDCVFIQPATDEIRTLIFFPDGHLRYDWEYGGAILL